MKILLTVKRNTIIKWNAILNSSVQGKHAFEVESVIEDIISPIIPRIGETLRFKDECFKILDVQYNVDHHNINGEIDHVYVFIQPEIILIDYYGYMKRFTHCYDYMKKDHDITKVDNYKDYIVTLPNTLEEWRRDISDITKDVSEGFSEEERLNMANRRCRLKTESER